MRENLFGTDGIRGTVNVYPMNADVMLKLGIAIGLHLKKSCSLSCENCEFRLRAVIAKDTRLSGYMIEQALTSGLISAGIDVTLVGPMPTAAVPMLVHSLRADFGIMITASHNPHYDNGIKLFDSHGLKIGDREQREIQTLVEDCSNILKSKSYEELFVRPEMLGRAVRLDDAVGRYTEYVKNAFRKERKLSGFRIVVDCANGASYKIAPSIFWELGADVIAIHNKPDGLNINHGCGSTVPTDLSFQVVECGADIGFAFDGDADRLVVCDERGHIIHGDFVIALLAVHLLRLDKLHNNCVVVAQDSNAALVRYLKTMNIHTFMTKTGDRYVSEEMRKHGAKLGGEQSGHIILGEYGYTGDGMVAALHVMDAVAESKKLVSEVFNLFKLNPFVRDDVGFLDRNPLDCEKTRRCIDELIESHKHLRIIVRASGTEKKVRLFVEGPEESEIQSVISEIRGCMEISQNTSS